MNLDYQNTFSDKQSLVYGDNGAVVSTNTLKHAAAKNLGAGKQMRLLINAATTAEAVAGASTLQTKLIGSNDDFATKETIVDTGALTKPLAGNKFYGIPSHTPCKDYRIEYAVGANGDKFTVTAALVIDQQTSGAGF